MRVITGSAKGRVLETPAGESTRPTSGVVKEAMLSAIQFEIENAFVLDLFAGSGQLGIEALSRGARFAVFVDKGKDALAAIGQNLANVKLDQNARVLSTDAAAFLKNTTDTFDIAFVDPPYKEDWAQRVLPALVKKMSPGGVIVFESGRKDKLPDMCGEFALAKEYCFGVRKVSIYRHTEM